MICLFKCARIVVFLKNSENCLLDSILVHFTKCFIKLITQKIFSFKMFLYHGETPSVPFAHFSFFTKCSISTILYEMFHLIRSVSSLPCWKSSVSFAHLVSSVTSYTKYFISIMLKHLQFLFHFEYLSPTISFRMKLLYLNKMFSFCVSNHF